MLAVKYKLFLCILLTYKDTPAQHIQLHKEISTSLYYRLNKILDWDFVVSYVDFLCINVMDGKKWRNEWMDGRIDG